MAKIFLKKNLQGSMLDIEAAGIQIHTSYGIIKEDAKQNAHIFTTLCEECGFRLVEREENGAHFYLRFAK